MKKILTKLATLVLIFLGLFIIREAVMLYRWAADIHILFALGLMIFLAGVVVYYALIPLWQIYRLPVHAGPVTAEKEVPRLMDSRFGYFRDNPFLREKESRLQEMEATRDNYDILIGHLKPEAEAIRRKYVTQLFYASSIAQNGFLDAVIILSSAVNMVKEIFVLYNGRVSTRDLWKIGRKIYIAMLIGGSEGVEYATREMISKLASDGLKGMPFVDKLLGSFADGFVNSILLTRIALITENYCTVLYIRSDKDLAPNTKMVISTTKHITTDIVERLRKTLGKLMVEKTTDFAMYAVNPVRYVWDKTAEKMPGSVDFVKETLRLSWSPFDYGFRKISGLFGRNRNGGVNDEG